MAYNVGLVLPVLTLCTYFCEGFFFSHHNKTRTTTPTNITLGDVANGDDDTHIDPVKAEAGTIAGVVFGVIICGAFITFVGIMYIRRKRERDQEYDRKAKVLKMSSQSAGVYMDTTSEMDMSLKPRHSGKGAEYRALRKDRNVYESDSEDELWSAKTDTG